MLNKEVLAGTFQKIKIKKTVNTFNCEFGYELIAAIPYAYYLYKNDMLEKTISAKLTEPLYYFSSNHEINSVQRSWENTLRFINYSGIPNVMVHTPKLDTTQFIPPPYKQHFANDEYKWNKPIICICNKYNNEWGAPPINYFSLEILEILFNILSTKYQIIYFGVDLLDEMQDTAHSMHLGDRDLCKKFNDVILYQNLLKDSGLNWNELMLKIFANCNKFITLNGGYSIMASYFGGINIIYCKDGSETKPDVDSFNRWYHLFGGSKIVLSRTYDSLINNIKVNFL